MTQHKSPHTSQSARPQNDHARPRPRTTVDPDLRFGRNPVAEALKAERTINKAWIQDGPGHRELGALVAALKARGVPLLTVSKAALDRLSHHAPHQGIICQIASHAYADFDDIITRPSAGSCPPFVLLLDGVNDGHNLGAILRVADTAGVSGLILPTRRSVTLDGFVAKASAGAIEHVPVARVTNMTQAMERLKSEGFWIVATAPSGTVRYNTLDWSGKIALLIGSEGDGVAHKRLAHADAVVSIPEHGHINSLNVAVATGIVVFEALRQRCP